MRDTDLNMKTHVNGFCVSTVKLSVAHSWGPDLHDDYWYETYVFPSDGRQITEWLEVWGDRYRDANAARKGHERVVEKVRSGEIPEQAEE